MIIDTISADLITARKARDAGTLSILGMVKAANEQIVKDRPGQPVTDADTIKVIKKLIDANKELIGAVKDPSLSNVVQAKAEIAILTKYLPTQMDETALELAIRDCQIANPTANLGQVMATLKSKHGGLYDGKLASEIAKRVLAEAVV